MTADPSIPATATPADAADAAATPAEISVEATEADRGRRLDRVLADRIPAMSRTRLGELIGAGAVVRSAPGAASSIREASHKVKPGERFTLSVPPPEPALPRPENLPLDIVYEDADLIVIDKPAGMVVHPAVGHSSGTLVNALIAHCGESLSGIGGVKRPGIVHRLDKDTSGLLAVAKSDAAHAGLSAQFKAHGRDGRLSRGYLALVWGRPERATGRIEARLARSSAHRHRVSVISGDRGREAVTHYRVLKTARDAKGAPLVSLLALGLETGRTHQIRVHMAHAGHPVLGDKTYGQSHATKALKLPPEARAALEALGRQALHAGSLGLVHPLSGRRLAFERPPPADMARLIALLDLR